MKWLRAKHDRWARRLEIFQRRVSMRDKSIYLEDTSAKSRRERKREGEEGVGDGEEEKKRESCAADAATTKSGHLLKFTSARRARTLSLSSLSVSFSLARVFFFFPFASSSTSSSFSRGRTDVEIRSIDRSEPRTRVFPDLRIHRLECRGGTWGGVDSRMGQSGDRARREPRPRLSDAGQR